MRVNYKRFYSKVGPMGVMSAKVAVRDRRYDLWVRQTRWLKMKHPPLVKGVWARHQYDHLTMRTVSIRSWRWLLGIWW